MREIPTYRVLYEDDTWSNWRPITHIDVNGRWKAVQCSEQVTLEEYEKLYKALSPEQ